eukprot:Sspe_Gene.115934::Locus_104130_Transcript_1_1_Confidence_1.000_Length_714::g.115934::m.115934
MIDTGSPSGGSISTIGEGGAVVGNDASAVGSPVKYLMAKRMDALQRCTEEKLMSSKVPSQLTPALHSTDVIDADILEDMRKHVVLMYRKQLLHTEKPPPKGNEAELFDWVKTSRLAHLVNEEQQIRQKIQAARAAFERTTLERAALLRQWEEETRTLERLSKLEEREARALVAMGEEVEGSMSSSLFPMKASGLEVYVYRASKTSVAAALLRKVMHAGLQK